jgi:hypothetical protein
MRQKRPHLLDNSLIWAYLDEVRIPLIRRESDGCRKEFANSVPLLGCHSRLSVPAEESRRQNPIGFDRIFTDTELACDFGDRHARE